MTTGEHIRRAHLVAYVCCGIVIIAALTILYGWWFNVDSMTMITPGSTVGMRPNSAIAMFGTALAVIAYLRKWPLAIGLGLAGLVFIIGAVNAVEQMIGTSWRGFDMLVTPERAATAINASATPGRLGPNATFAFIALGVAVTLLLLHRAPSFRQILASMVGFLGLIALFGHALGVERVEGFVIGSASRMANDSAFGLTLLGMALLCAGIEYGFTKVEVSTLAGGRLARVLIPSVIVIIFGCTLIVKWTLLQPGDSRLALQIDIAAITAIMLVVSMYVSIRIDKVDQDRETLLVALESRAKRSEELQAIAADLAFSASRPDAVAVLATQMVTDSVPTASHCLFLQLSRSVPSAPGPDQLTLAALTHRDPQASAMLREIYAVPTPLAVSNLATVVATGVGRITQTPTMDEVRANIDERFWPYWAQVGAGSFVTARVDVDGEPEGLLVIGSSGGVTLGEADLGYLEEVAKVLGLALTAARFYTELQRTNRTLESRVIQRTAEVEAARAQLEAVVESAADAIYTIDANGMITSVNRAAEVMFGYTSAEMIGMNSLLLRVPDERAEVSERLQAAVASGMAGGAYQRTMLRSNGERFQVETTAGEVPATADAGAVFTLITRDVTAQVEAERRLRAAEERFRSAFENAPIGMAMTGLDGRWLRVNRALASIVGYPQDALLALDFTSITHPEDRGRDAELLAAVVKGDLPSYTREKRYYHRDGHLVWVNLSVSLVRDVDESPLYFIAQMEDVTGRRELLDQLNRSNEDLRRFAYVASHDLQAPLRTVGGFTEVLLNSFEEGSLNSEQQVMADYISSGVERMQQLIRDLLSYGRIDADARRENLTLRPIFDDALQALDGDIKASGAVVSFGHDESFSGDRAQLRQVLQNLIANAIVHGSTAGSAAVEIDVTSRRRPDGFIEVSVRDNGPGIAPEHHERIFEMFKQLKAGGGTGIGLAIVQRIVDAHGGRIWVESDGANGATLLFTLQASAEASQS